MIDLETLTRLLEAYDRDKRSPGGPEAWLRLNVAAYDALPDLISTITALQAMVEALTAERDAAIRELGSYAREAGEAKGRLERHEAGIVDDWRERCEAAEAKVAEQGRPKTLALNVTERVARALFDAKGREVGS